MTTNTKSPAKPRTNTGSKPAAPESIFDDHAGENEKPKNPYPGKDTGGEFNPARFAPSGEKKPKKLDPVTSPDVPVEKKVIPKKAKTPRQPASVGRTVPPATVKAPRARKPSDAKPRSHTKAKGLDAGIPPRERSILQAADKMGPTLDAAAVAAENNRTGMVTAVLQLRSIFNGVASLLGQAQHLLQDVDIDSEFMSMKADVLSRVVATSKGAEALRSEIAAFVSSVASAKTASDIRAAVMDNGAMFARAISDAQAASDTIERAR